MHGVTRKPYAVLATTLACCLAAAASEALAGEADVLDVSISALGKNKYRIDATVKHDDAGWDHYANYWDVLDADGQLLGSRELLHPHDEEQPFTRSLTLTIPENVHRIRIRAHDSVHQFGGRSVEIDVPR